MPNWHKQGDLILSVELSIYDLQLIFSNPPESVRCGSFNIEGRHTVDTHGRWEGTKQLRLVTNWREGIRMTPQQAHLVEEAATVLAKWNEHGSDAALETLGSFGQDPVRALQSAPQGFIYLAIAIAGSIAIAREVDVDSVLETAIPISPTWFGVVVNVDAVRMMAVAISRNSSPDPTGMDVPTAVASSAGLAYSLMLDWAKRVGKSFSEVLSHFAEGARREF